LASYWAASQEPTGISAIQQPISLVDADRPSQHQLAAVAAPHELPQGLSATQRPIGLMDTAAVHASTSTCEVVSRFINQLKATLPIPNY